MAILAGDIKLLASEVMDDVDEGGGAPTSTVILDGASNAIFPDISEAARAGGEVSIRHLFTSIQTDNTDTLLGANVIIAEPPADPNVSVLVFESSDYFEQRAAARNRVEAYLYASTILPGHLLEDHIKGMRALQVAQRPGTELPVVDQTLCLVQNEGLISEVSQYVRVRSVSSILQKFTYTASNGDFIDFDVQVSTVELTDPLRYKFTGSAANRAFAAANGAAKLRTTIVADATKFYGAAKTTMAAAVGDTSMMVESVYTRIVPSAQTEIAIVDRSMTGTSVPLVSAANVPVSTTLTIAMIPAGGVYYLPTGSTPGSLSITTPSGVLTDDGLGGLLLGSAAAGTIDYQSGVLSLSTGIAAGSVTESYIPAAAVSMQAYTLSREVTAENRAYVMVIPLTPIPAPGVTAFSYMAGGDWYELRDDGQGSMAGTDSAYGSGRISYTTGTLNVTLGALPDVGSAVIISWGTQQEFLPLTTTSLSIEQPKIEFDLGGPADAGSVTLSWMAGGVAKTAHDNGSGAFTGDATGVIYYGAGTGWIRTADMPDSSGIAAAFEAASGKTFGTTAAGGTLTGTLPDAPLEPGSIVAALQLLQTIADADSGGHVATSSRQIPATIRDDGSGGWVLDGYGALIGSSINYTTGAYIIAVSYTAVTPVATYTTTTAPAGVLGVMPGSKVTTFAGYSASSVSRSIAAGGVSFRYREAGSATTAGSISIAAPSMTLDLQPWLKGANVPGSLRFRIGNYQYVERAGVLYHSISRATGAGVEAGTINYATGKAAITSWSAGTFSFALESGLVNPGTPGMAVVMGRVPSRPLKSQSFSLAAVTLDGDTISAIAEATGAVSAAQALGTIDIETGIYSIAFGAFVDGAWVSKLVDPSSIKFSAVAYSYLPLDAGQIGMDPVRLPTDGRVTIFREGDFAVAGHTNSRTLTVSNGQTVNLGRSRLSRARVIGADKALISTGYSVDLDAGTITFSNVIGYIQPVTIEDRIEDMMRISDVQINGLVSFARPLSHVYPAGSTLSSALWLGNLKARVSNFYDQATWNKAWADSIVGDAATGTYDKATYPVVVTNRGAVTERWAIYFTNTTTFQVHGEHLGVIATGTTAEYLAPVNPATGVPYFRLQSEGWGLGWAAGNVLRFNTTAAGPSFDVLRTVQQGAETITNDKFALLVRGDIDKV